jgi:general secretion pathway protein H
VKTFAASSETGFTLIELLMVIFVVGIMAGLVVLSVGGNTTREFKRDAAKLQQLLVMAQDEAPFSGREIGLSLARDGKSYCFLYFDDKKMTWEPLEKEVFSQRILPDNYQLDLVVSGTRVDLKKIYKDSYEKSDLDNWLTADNKKKTTAKQPDPWLIFFSDGQYTPFRLNIKNSHAKDMIFIIEGDGFGAIHMREATASDKSAIKKRKPDNV